MDGDLISRSALLADIQAAVENGGMGAVVAGTLKRYVKRVPAVDAVKVVRCKDCNLRCETDDGEYNPEDIVCTYWATDGLKACDFCSRSERRADE